MCVAILRFLCFLVVSPLLQVLEKRVEDFEKQVGYTVLEVEKEVEKEVEVLEKEVEKDVEEVEKSVGSRFWQLSNSKELDKLQQRLDKKPVGK